MGGRTMKRILVFCCVLLTMAVVFCGNAMAASSVAYEGGAEKFVFVPENSDLFENFKGVMPGDVLEQKITVKNNTDKAVRIYLRADSVAQTDRDFLGQLDMTVSAGSKEIFDAAPSETAQLTNNTLLGTFKKDGGTELTVTLKVPLELSPEYMDRAGTVLWTFLTEEVDEGDGDTPQTGDWFRMNAWMMAVVLIAVLIAAVLLFDRAKRKAK